MHVNSIIPDPSKKIYELLGGEKIFLELPPIKGKLEKYHPGTELMTNEKLPTISGIVDERGNKHIHIIVKNYYQHRVCSSVLIFLKFKGSKCWSLIPSHPMIKSPSESIRLKFPFICNLIEKYELCEGYAYTEVRNIFVNNRIRNESIRKILPNRYEDLFTLFRLALKSSEPIDLDYYFDEEHRTRSQFYRKNRINNLANIHFNF